MALQVGQIYGGKYRVLRVLGEGFAGAVYEGEIVEIHRRVALETLSNEFEKYPDALRRFQKEAEALGKLETDHVARVFDFVEIANGPRCLVREFLEGITLEQRIREAGRLSADEASRFGYEIAEGLAAAHAEGVVHRGLGPASAFLTRGQAGQDQIKLIAFGLFLPKDDYKVGPSHYAAPEQIKGNVDIDGRTDVYAAGVVLYECLAGQVPFAASSADDLGFQIVMQDPTPLEKIAPDVDLELATIVHKAMARDMRVRYQSAREFGQALSTFRSRRGFGAATKPTKQASPSDVSLSAMSAPDDDDDQDLGDHGTVVMNRKLPFIPANASSRPMLSPPAPPPPQSLPLPPMPAAATNSLNNAPVAQGLPALPPSITGLHPQASATKQQAPPEKLIAMVALGAFGVVFIFGALIMLIFRLAAGPAEEEPSNTPAASASAVSVAPVVAPNPASTAAANVAPPAQEAATGATTTSTPSTKSGRSTSGPKSSGGHRRITNDL